jgi:hypothetical protein
MYFSLPNITGIMYIQYMREVILSPIQNVVEIYKQITIIAIYEVSSGLVTLVIMECSCPYSLFQAH